LICRWGTLGELFKKIRVCFATSVNKLVASLKVPHLLRKPQFVTVPQDPSKTFPAGKMGVADL